MATAFSMIAIIVSLRKLIAAGSIEDINIARVSLIELVLLDLMHII